MSKRFWLLGLVGLVLVGLLLACSPTYSPNGQQGLVVVGSQGSALLETFAFDLSNGGVAAIANTPIDTSELTCVLNGIPFSIVIDPSGTYAYAIMNAAKTVCPASATGIQAFLVHSDGNITPVGSLVPDPNPVALAMDSAGKFLFVAEGQQGVANVYAIGSGATLTAVQSSFTLPPMPRSPNFVALAATPTVFPNVGINGTQNSNCSVPGTPPPTSEYLYLVDANNYDVLEFAVNTTTGALGNPGVNPTEVFAFPTDEVPAGVAVDPCDRFVYVSDFLTNKVSAYQICIAVIMPVSGQQSPCPYADGSLVPVPGSPFLLVGSANGPGPLVVDPFGNNLYVLGTLSNTISLFKISQRSGSLGALTPPTIATGLGPVAMAIRQDDNWLFVTNYGTQTLGGTTVSQYSIAPGTGALTVLPVIQTDNYPYGIAVK
jgi:6-phosphogluconolactonase (cycloisomerase 2 family)